jgi:DNA polymerase III subunit delta'
VAVGVSARAGEEAPPEVARRVARRARTDALDHGLALVGAWFRDLAAVAEGADELVLASDRLSQLAADAEGLDPRAARHAGEAVGESRRRLRVNVGEELALQALLFRVASVLRTA